MGFSLTLEKLENFANKILLQALMGTHRFGTFLHKGFVLVQDLTGGLFWYMAGVSFWCMKIAGGFILVHN